MESKNTCVEVFGKRLKELRKVNGYTIEQFADMVGISKITLGYYENDKDVFWQFSITMYRFSHPPVSKFHSTIYANNGTFSDIPFVHLRRPLSMIAASCSAL